MQDSITLPIGSTLATGVVLSTPTIVRGSFGLRGQGSRSEVQQSDMLRERGEYAADLPLGTLLLPAALVRFQNRIFRVVWTPPAGAFEVVQTYGLEEVR